MFDKDKDKKEKLEELINLANTPEEELEKENDRLKHINSRLNGKSNILKESFIDLINRI